jgi:tRNA-dihydrouridine synthase B
MLSIGSLSLDSLLLLSPMAGVTDLPFRLLNRSFGCGLAFTEMLNAGLLLQNSKPTLKMLSTTPEDRPLGVQILGADPETIRKALARVSELGFDLVDFNAACPVKKVVARGEGAGLVREPEKLQRLLKVMVDNSRTPVTVKIRTGWDNASVNAVEVALRAEDAGVRGLFIHGRTKRQGYEGGVDYDTLRRVKRSLKIPVIASGDALTPDLIRKLLDETGCDGVAVARGALGNPWIFRQTAEYLKGGIMPRGPDAWEIARVMMSHLEMNVAFYGEKTGVVRFRKFFPSYTKRLDVIDFRDRAFHAQSRQEMVQLIERIREAPEKLPEPPKTGERKMAP